MAIQESTQSIFRGMAMRDALTPKPDSFLSLFSGEERIRISHSLRNIATILDAPSFLERARRERVAFERPAVLSRDYDHLTEEQKKARLIDAKAQAHPADDPIVLLDTATHRVTHFFNAPARSVKAIIHRN